MVTGVAVVMRLKMHLDTDIVHLFVNRKLNLKPLSILLIVKSQSCTKALQSGCTIQSETTQYRCHSNDIIVPWLFLTNHGPE